MKYLSEPGLEISLLFRKVRDDVFNRTGRQQEPYTYGSLPAQPFFDVGRVPGRAALGEELIDVRAVAEVSRHAAGRRVRLPDKSELFQTGHHVTERRRRHPEPAAGQPERRDRLALLDEGLHEGGEDPPISFG